MMSAMLNTTKCPEAILIANITFVTVTDTLQSIFIRIGFPQEIQNDKLSYFTTARITKLSEMFGIKVRFSSMDHQYLNSVEIFHWTAKLILWVL